SITLQGCLMNHCPRMLGKNAGGVTKYSLRRHRKFASAKPVLSAVYPMGISTKWWMQLMSDKVGRNYLPGHPVISLLVLSGDGIHTAATQKLLMESHLADATASNCPHPPSPS
ncbi:MAG: hypothetical protein KGK16_10950, partial [Bradyrhizobium sp.]|nr:hypothetical protein [Bradyrhizobium sp.]